jgi:hypothetical protein
MKSDWFGFDWKVCFFNYLMKSLCAHSQIGYSRCNSIEEMRRQEGAPDRVPENGKRIEIEIAF